MSLKKSLLKGVKKLVDAYFKKEAHRKMSVVQTVMYYDYLHQHDYWNPNANNVFVYDSLYPVPVIQKLIEKYIPGMDPVQGSSSSGEQILQGEYKDYSVLLTFSLHNARQLKIYVNMTVEAKDLNRKYNSLAEKLNSINESEDLIHVGIIKHESTIVCTFSTIILITDTFGNENDIIKAYDNLIDFGSAFLKNNEDYKVLQKQFKPPYPEYVSDLEELKPQEDIDGSHNSALVQWFGENTDVVYRCSEVDADDKILSRTFPYPGSLWENQLEVAIYDVRDPIKISEAQLESIKLSVSKETPVLYKIEARDLLEIIIDPKEEEEEPVIGLSVLSDKEKDEIREHAGYKKDPLRGVTFDLIKQVCIEINARMHNLLIKCFWYEKEGVPNFSLVAFGLHYGKENPYSRIDVLVEFIKTYASLKTQINHLAIPLTHYLV